MTKKIFCNYMTELINQWKKREETFDIVQDFINFEPFYNTDFFLLSLKGIAIAIDEERSEYIVEILDWWLQYYFEGHLHDAIVEINGTRRTLDDMDDLYNFLSFLWVE